MRSTETTTNRTHRLAPLQPIPNLSLLSFRKPSHLTHLHLAEQDQFNKVMHSPPETAAVPERPRSPIRRWSADEPAARSADVTVIRRRSFIRSFVLAPPHTPNSSGPRARTRGTHHGPGSPNTRPSPPPSRPSRPCREEERGVSPRQAASRRHGPGRSPAPPLDQKRAPNSIRRILTPNGRCRTTAMSFPTRGESAPHVAARAPRARQAGTGHPATTRPFVRIVWPHVRHVRIAPFVLLSTIPRKECRLPGSSW